MRTRTQARLPPPRQVGIRTDTALGAAAQFLHSRRQDTFDRTAGSTTHSCCSEVAHQRDEAQREQQHKGHLVDRRADHAQRRRKRPERQRHLLRRRGHEEERRELQDGERGGAEGEAEGEGEAADGDEPQLEEHIPAGNSCALHS